LLAGSLSDALAIQRSRLESHRTVDPLVPRLPLGFPQSHGHQALTATILGWQDVFLSAALA
jgi:hypothetical protein